MRASTGVGTVEPPLAENLRSALIDILGKYMDRVVVGGVVQKSFGNFSVPLLAMEYKREIGEGGCDPMTQASYCLQVLAGKFCKCNWPLSTVVWSAHM